MPRRIKIATTSMATLEAISPPYNLSRPSPSDNLALGLSMLEAAGAHGVDLACLSETFSGAGLPGSAARDIAEPVPGPSFDAVAAIARKHAMHVVAGFYEVHDDRLYNIAALIDRSGKLAAKYAKAHPTAGEIEAGIVPGPDDAAVVETDFGRVGLAICFDVNWPELWSGMKQKRADMVCWISAYEAGFALRSLAWQHQMPIVSAVMPYHGRVIDRVGRIITETSRWSRVAVTTLNLDQRVFHTDGHAQLIMKIQERYGQRVTVTTIHEEHLFTVESNDPALDEGEIVREFGLVDLQTYLDDSTRAQRAARSQLAAARRETTGV